MKSYSLYLAALYTLGILTLSIPLHAQNLEHEPEASTFETSKSSKESYKMPPQTEETTPPKSGTAQSSEGCFSTPTFRQSIKLITHGVLIHFAVVGIFDLF